MTTFSTCNASGLPGRSTLLNLKEKAATKGIGNAAQALAGASSHQRASPSSSWHMLTTPSIEKAFLSVFLGLQMLKLEVHILPDELDLKLHITLLQNAELGPCCVQGSVFCRQLCQEQHLRGRMWNPQRSGQNLSRDSLLWGAAFSNC